MKTHFSAPMIRMCRAAPWLAKPALRIAARVLRGRPPHWVVGRIAADLDYRVVTETRLGNGMRMRVFWTDWVGMAICARGYHEPATVRVIEHFLRPGAVFVDVGANVGQYTLLAAGLAAEVHSFEPDPLTFRLLRHNVLTNGLTNVRLNACALAEDCNPRVLYSGRADNSGGSSLGGPRGGVTSWAVACQHLDLYVHRSGIARVDLLKLDVEGAELSVLRGAKTVLSASSPHIVLEFGLENQGLCSELAGFLVGLGYRLFRVQERGQVTVMNVLAVPSMSAAPDSDLPVTELGQTWR